jgi:SAM-dependent methyltransferase
VYEVPISYHGREYWEGKKIGWKDGVAAIWTIARCALSDDSAPDLGSASLHQSRRYNDWLWSRLGPALGDRVLEVGSGSGSFTRYLRNHAAVVATDGNAQHLEQLRTRFRQHDNIRVQEVDWRDPDLDGLGAERFDTVLCLNTLERIEQDDDALATFASLLDPGGRVVVQVPAMHTLYGEIDRAIGHVRRYDRDELAAKLRRHGFTVEQARYVNFPGMLIWYLNSRILRRHRVPAMQARLAAALVPWLENRVSPPWGMTLLVVGRKE